ncbi:MAG: hypothetical protein JSV54_01725 [Chloroflexota bacterium]|nr:MAG: hypothetical protein JSV54_01725 [Chloroflexota bacterium]
MWVYNRTRQEVALVQIPCPVCNTGATFQILKRRTKALYLIVPWFSTKYFAICGNCGTIFRITKKCVQEAEAASKKGADAEFNVFACPKCHSFNAASQKSCGICGARYTLQP